VLEHSNGPAALEIRKMGETILNALL